MSSCVRWGPWPLGEENTWSVKLPAKLPIRLSYVAAYSKWKRGVAWTCDIDSLFTELFWLLSEFV